MTDEQRKMIDKLNEDNRKLNDVNKGMKDYAKYKLVVGILVVTIIIVLYFIQHTTLSIPLSEVHAICYRSPHNPLKKSIFFKS